MSIETTEAQGAARDAEQAWASHRRHCVTCGSKQRPVRRCPEGNGMRETARQLRTAYQDSKRADKEPSENDGPLFGLAELGG